MDAKPFLARLRRNLRRVLVCDGLARVCGWGLLAISAVALLDRFNSLPGPVRLLLLLGIAVGMGVLVYRRLVRPLRAAMTDANLARVAERRIPDLNGRLFSAIDGIALGPADTQRVADLCTPAAAGRLIRNHGMVRALTGAVLLVVAVGGFAGLNPASFNTAVQRLFLPLGSARWNPSHELSAAFDQPVVPQDQPLVLAVNDGGGSPAPLSIRWRNIDSGSRDQRVPDAMSGPWRERLSLTPGSYRFDLEWGDASLAGLAAEVVERPALSGLRAELKPPAYTGRPLERLDSLANLAVLPGTHLTLFFATSSASSAKEAARQLTLHYGLDEIAIEQGEAGYHGGLLVTEAGELVVGIADVYGSGDDAVLVSARPEPRISVALLDDRVPLVRLSGLRRNEAVSPQAEVELLVQAQDDIALDALRLLASTENSAGEEGGEQTAEHELVAWPEVSGTRGETRRSHRIRIGALAGAGQQLVLVAEGRDGNDITGPGIGRSDPLPIRVVSDSELQQELDRNLAEIRDRIIQARDQLAPGLSDQDSLAGAARAARPVAERAAEQLGDVLRRWQQNHLDEGEDQLAAALALVQGEAVPRLKQVPQSGDQGEANEADRRLGEAERALARLLRSGDLVRELRNLVKRQEQVNEATRTFFRARLAGELGADAERQRKDLALRQQDLAQQLLEWQRRLLGSETEGLAEAKTMVQTSQPASVLDAAGRKLDARGGLQQAVKEQGEATEVMRDLLDLLAGSEEAAQLAERAGRLAERQEDLQARLAAGERARDLTEEQKELEQETRELQKQVENESDNDEAKAALEGAASAQQEAGKAMQGGRQSPAEREAAAAAAQLRRAQRALGGDQQQQQGEKKEPQVDLIALLRKLSEQQARVVSGVEVLLKDGVGVDGAKLGFADRRKVSRVAELQQEVQLQLQADIISELEQMPIALRALTRVERAVTASFDHLESPALGSRALRLAKIALHEMQRLLAIVDGMPTPKQGDQQQQGQGQGQEGRQAPFPPAAQLALLAGEQRELRRATAANRPVDLAAAQGLLQELAELVAGQTRPGTRPNVLMQRAVRAMASAADLLSDDDRGATTRSEQDVAVAMLEQILAEAKGSQSQSQNPKSSQSQRQKPQQGAQQRQQSEADRKQGEKPGDQNNGQAQAGQDGQPGGDQAHGGDSVEADVNEQRWMHLPKVERERLKEALGDAVPPEGIELLRAYLEVLEGQGP
ncbi:MAG: hypothetical protein PF961_14445 [Planctomycetota bacterium]|jgi:hypothetical protein|nr:hypothetical protein [Planctomycetota bacterium]